jgi:hypothetical protein
MYLCLPTGRQFKERRETPMAITQASDRVPVVSDPLAAMRDAWSKGQDVEEAVYGTGDSEGNVEVEVQEEEVQPEPEVGTEPVEAEVQVQVKSEPSQTPSSDVEYVYVKGTNGKKQKIEVSYTDKEKIKQAYLKMAGMDKFRKERDDERKSKAELQSKIEALSSDFSKLQRKRS